MKKSKFLWSLMAVSLMASCSHEDNPNIEPDHSIGKEGVYVAITLNPSGKHGSTRSETSGDNASNDGVEVGSTAENAVNTALIVLANRADNSYIASSFVDPSVNTKVSITAGTTGGGDSQPLYKAIAQFDRTEISTYYGKEGNVGEINVFVICNPIPSLIDKMEVLEDGDTDWVNWEWNYNGTDPNESIWNSSKGFVMTNVNLAPRNLPAKYEYWNLYTSPTTPFDLSGVNNPGAEGAVDNSIDNGGGDVRVHRMAARFDFRDGSQVEGPNNNGKIGTPFTYEVIKDEDGNTIVECKILSMGLTNMSNSQYYLGRVSDNGLPTGANYALCGNEKPWFNGEGGNYVISTYAEKKDALIDKDFNTYFQHPFFNENGLVYDKGDGWDWIKCEDVVGNGNKDNYGSNNYNVWRYLSENTIPGPPRKQVNAQSTGVIFKTRILPTAVLKNSSDTWEQELFEVLTYASQSVGEGKLLNKNSDTDPILYSLLSNNTIYVSWENVRAVALADAGYDASKGANQSLDRSVPMYKLCYGEGGVGTVGSFIDNKPEDQTSANYLWQLWDNERKVDPYSVAAENAKLAFKSKVTSLGFALYQSSEDAATGEWGYYCYYYYWNRHNDNLQNGVMGPMEFAVVRNNVYKLMVTRISTLGHPRIPENDPDDPKPDTPDESSEVYISVNVEVIPWVVRVNNIDF